MPKIPEQVRSLDPWNENRFTNNYNVRSRILSKGNDVIVGLDSFKLTASTDPYTFTVGPGMFIKDDVLIHFKDDTIIHTNTEEGYLEKVSGWTEPPNSQAPCQLHIVLEYKYARSVPPKQASLSLLKIRTGYEKLDINKFNPVTMMWLGYAQINASGIITILSWKPTLINNTTTWMRRTIVDPWKSEYEYNGGVIRYDDDGTTVGWFNEWDLY